VTVEELIARLSEFPGYHTVWRQEGGRIVGVAPGEICTVDLVGDGMYDSGCGL
jgi:hypothetical protein